MLCEIIKLNFNFVISLFIFIFASKLKNSYYGQGKRDYFAS
jgi:hypothetical protein